VPLVAVPAAVATVTVAVSPGARLELLNTTV
jgi:hypothetical protein